jgi:hypothetical protein
VCGTSERHFSKLKIGNRFQIEATEPLLILSGLRSAFSDSGLKRLDGGNGAKHFFPVIRNPSITVIQWAAMCQKGTFAKYRVNAILLTTEFWNIGQYYRKIRV